MEQTTPLEPVGGSLRIVAGISVAALFIVAGWQSGIAQQVPAKTFVADSSFPLDSRDYIEEADANHSGVPDWQEALFSMASTTTTASSSPETPIDRISDRLVGGYVQMKNSNSYTPAQGERLSKELANYVTYSTEFTPYTEDDVVITPDVSKEALEAHRKALQKVLNPFLGITMPEMVIYANYVEKHDERALTELSARAALYKKASQDMLAVPAPTDIATTHLEIANALSFFAAVLDHMVAKAQDPIATLALLHTYNQSEQYVQQTFNSLVAVYRQKLYPTL